MRKIIKILSMFLLLFLVLTFSSCLPPHNINPRRISGFTELINSIEEIELRNIRIPIELHRHGFLRFYLDILPDYLSSERISEIFDTLLEFFYEENFVNFMENLNPTPRELTVFLGMYHNGEWRWSRNMIIDFSVDYDHPMRYRGW